MWSFSHADAVLAALASIVLSTPTPTNADESSWEWRNDELCTYCQSYVDEDVGAGNVRTSYIPGVGYPSSALAELASAHAKQLRIEACDGCTTAISSGR